MSDTTRIDQVVATNGFTNRHDWLSTANLTFSPADVTIDSELLSNMAGSTTASVPDYLQMLTSRLISDRIDSAIMNGEWNAASTTSNTYPYRRVSRDPAHEPVSSWLFDEESIRDAVERTLGSIPCRQGMLFEDDVEPSDSPVEPELIPQEDLLQVINLE